MSLDWRGLVAVGIGDLRIPPAVFWQLTPAELTLMMGVSTGIQQRMTRARLRQLSDTWPDMKSPTEATGKDTDSD